MIVKIQNRRGEYLDYDPSKLLPGEFAVVQVGDPNTPTGKGVYLAITAGDVVRLATEEEIAAYTQQFDDIYHSTLQDAGLLLEEAKRLISNYTGGLTVVDSVSEMTDTDSLYLYNGSGQYKNYVYIYDPDQSEFVPLLNYGTFGIDRYKSYTASTDNVESIYTPGIYFIGNSVAGKPLGTTGSGTGGVLIVGGYGTQNENIVKLYIYTSQNTNDRKGIYMQTYAGATGYEWTKVPTSEIIGTLSTQMSALNNKIAYTTVLSATTYNDRASVLSALDTYASSVGDQGRIVGYIGTANSGLLGLTNTSHYFDYYVNSNSYRLLVARPVNGSTAYQLAKQGGTWSDNWMQFASQTSVAANATAIDTNASNIAENATNIAGLATGVTNKVVKTTLSTTQTYANATTDTYNYLSVPGISDYEIVMVRADCANLRQWLMFVNGDNTPLYLREYAGTNSIRGGYYVDWTNERIGVRYLGATGAYTSTNVYFTNVVGFVKQGAIDGSGSSEFTPYDTLYDAIIAYVDEHYTPSSSDSVPNEVKQAIYTLLSKAAYTETGLTDELAVVESWTATTFNITNSLTNCASSNSATIVNSRTRYITTLTANTGYVLNTVTVTMGGVDITSTAYSSGTITIPSVTGDIVITATAVAAAASLSAVYTQSGTVYEDTSLDSLKSDLVVTATYSDSTTATVPSSDYTLSGTLTEGTSTVTVSYAGVTTTFSVTVSTHVLFEVTNRAVDKTAACEDTRLEFLKTDHDFTILFDGTQTSAIPSGYSQRLFFCASADTSWRGVFCGGGNNTNNYSAQWYGVSTANIGANRNSTNARMRIAYRHTAGSDKAVIATKLNNNTIVNSEPSYTFASNGNAHLFIGGASASSPDANWVGTITRCTVYDNVLTDDEINTFLA